MPLPPAPVTFRRLPLSNSRRYALVDEADYERVCHLRWRVTRDGYVVSGSGRNVIHLHRLIAGTPVGMDTDHAEGRRLDNRRSRLRVCGRGQNNANSRPRRSRTGYRGVYVTARGRYRAQIRVGRKLHNLGTFARAVDAARVYDAAARAHFGEFATCNYSPDGRRRLRRPVAPGANRPPPRPA